MKAEYQLTPNEYMIWKALITACTKIYFETQHSNTVSIPDICRELNLNTSVVQKIITLLQNKGLAKQIGDRWVYIPTKAQMEKNKNSNGTAAD